MTSETAPDEAHIDKDEPALIDPAWRARVDRLTVLGTFALGVAHELSTPIGSLEMTARFAVETDDPDRRQQLLRTIVRDAERCRLIFESLSRFVSEGLLEKHDANTSGIIRRCAQRVREEGGNLSLEVTIARDAQMILCHPPALEQVLCNLMRNAVQAGGGSSSVILSVARAGNILQITCEDNGPGIAPASAERVFQPFYSAATGHEGMGLGLTLARHVIDAHGGTIRVAAPGASGARFVIELPAT